MKKLKTANSKDSKDPSSGSSPTDVPTASETGKKPGDKVNEEIRKSGETVFAAAVDSYPVLVDVDDPQLRDPEVFIVASLVKTQGGFNPDNQVWSIRNFILLAFGGPMTLIKYALHFNKNTLSYNDP